MRPRRLFPFPLALVLAGPAAADAPPVVDPALMSAPAAAYRDATRSGGPGKDGIPSIDAPRFLAADADEVERQLDAGDIVIGIYRNGEARAYPQSIVVWHEIVNDTVGGDAVAVTYCPLTGTALGFERGDTELGVSGNLLNSNLVMYDRATDSRWPQILGAAVDGPLEGRGLGELRVFWTTWENWRQRYPDTKVLAEETGHIRNYDRDPYGSYNPRRGYYRPESSPMFPLMNDDGRYPPKSMVLGFRTGDVAVAVDREYLREAGVVEREIEGERFVVVHDPGLDTGWAFRADGAAGVDPDAVAFDRDGPRGAWAEGLEPVSAFEAMWFAWAAFYPDTIVINGGG